MVVVLRVGCSDVIVKMITNLFCWFVVDLLFCIYVARFCFPGYFGPKMTAVKFVVVD